MKNDDIKDLRLGALITVSAGMINTLQLILVLLKLFDKLTCGWFPVLLPLILESVVPVTITLIFEVGKLIDDKKNHKKKLQQQETGSEV